YNLSGGSLTAGLININTGGHFFRNGGTLNYDILNFQGGDYTGDLVNQTLITGTGTINGNLVNAGTVSPGQSPGKLSINGSYTQTATGTYQAEIASTSVYDQIDVTGSPGTANLNGALAVSLLGGYRPLGNQVFSIITATGGITGTFSNIINQQIGLTLLWQLRYNTNSVDLVAQRDYTGSSLGLTRNQWAVANMLNGVADTATGDLNTVLNAIDSLGTADEVRSAYTQISPEKAGALASLGLTGARSQMRNLAEFITNGRFGTRAVQSAFGVDSLGSSGISGAGLMLAYNGSSLAQLLTGSKGGTTASPWGFYLLPNLLLGSQASTLNQTGYAFTGAGFTLGGDFRVRDDLLVGAATGYNHLGASFHGSGGYLENNNWPITAYAAYLPQSFYAFGSLGYSLNLFTLNRNISFDGVSRHAKSSPTGHQFNGYGEAGYDLKWRRLVVTPFASLAYSRIWVNGFKEDGANSLNLQVNSQSAASLQTGVGAKISLPIKRNATLMVPQFYASYQHEFADDSRGLDARLSQGGSTFTWLTEEPRRDYAVLGTNVTLGIRKNVRAQLDYNVEVGRGIYTAHSLTAGLRWEF
ncbi:MAG: autotransporter domain-containing protein, partial [Syntrophales bacterium]|nr:autotransporter domain-containing protein [Syntrophales bacterium]